MALEETHANVSVKDLSELVFELHRPLLHLNKALLFSHIASCES